jgi:hypothetical protein
MFDFNITRGRDDMAIGGIYGVKYPDCIALFSFTGTDPFSSGVCAYGRDLKR